MTAFANTRRILAVYAASPPHLLDEAMLQSAKSEVNSADEQAVHPIAPLGASRVTTDEAVRALGDLFYLMERNLAAMRAARRGALIITNETADAFIAAKDVLKRAGYEPVAKRKHDPLVLTPVRRA